MIYVDTDRAGVRTYRMPRAVADVATEIFPGTDLTDAVFLLARAISMDAVHTIERIALNCSHAAAVNFAREHLVTRQRHAA